MKDLQHEDIADSEPVLALPESTPGLSKWREMGARDALDGLLRENSERVRAMARSWSRVPSLQDDLISEGMLALIACLDTYEPRANVPFFAYASPFVRAAMRRTYYRETCILSVPLHHIRSLREGKGSELDAALFRSATNPERLDAENAPELGSDGDTGEAALIRAEAETWRGKALESALAALSDTDRALVERRRNGGEAGAEQRGKTQTLQMEARAMARLRTQLILRGVTSADAGCAS